MYHVCIINLYYKTFSQEYVLKLNLLNLFLLNTRDLMYIMWKPVEKADKDQKDTKTNDTKNWK